jgi:hypothetical protein
MKLRTPLVTLGVGLIVSDALPAVNIHINRDMDYGPPVVPGGRAGTAAPAPDADHG